MRLIASLRQRVASQTIDRRQVRDLASRHPSLAATIRQVRLEGLTYLSAAALADLAEAALAVEHEGIAGDVIETGTALGGSAIVLAMAKSAQRQLTLYDTFGMIPPPSDQDGDDVRERYARIEAGQSKGIGGGIYYGYRSDLLGEVRTRMAHFGVDPGRANVGFVKGLYEDTLQVHRPVALAHIDCDWYESVKTCLERIDPHLVSGGRFIIDDYEAWSGARRAVDEFLAERSEYETEQRARLQLVKL